MKHIIALSAALCFGLGLAHAATTVITVVTPNAQVDDQSKMESVNGKSEQANKLMNFVNGLAAGAYRGRLSVKVGTASTVTYRYGY